MSSKDRKAAERRSRQELDAVRRAVDSLSPLIEQLAVINEQARALGMFVEDLHCSNARTVGSPKTSSLTDNTSRTTNRTNLTRVCASSKTKQTRTA